MLDGGIMTTESEILRKRCDALLTALLGKNLVDNWWKSPNKAFCDDTPEVIFAVAPRTVYNYLMKYYDAGGT